MDADALAFLLLCFVDLLSLFLCHKWLEKLEPDDSPETRLRLRAAVCALAMALALAFAWRMDLDMTWPPAVVVWSLSAAVSFGGFGMFVYAGGDGEHGFRTRKMADLSSVLLVIAMSYMTVSFALLAYRSRHDARALAFVLFFYVDLLSIFLLLKWLEKLGPDGSPETMARIRAAVCALVMALAVAIACRVGLFLKGFYAMHLILRTDKQALLPT